MRALVTGGCGFIGSHVVRGLLADGWEVTNLDALTYAANPANLADVDSSEGYRFVQGDICDATAVAPLVEWADVVLNFAAETHVDRSLLGPAAFVRTDVEGVVTLLEALRANPGTRFVQMSTDEVFGPTEPPHESGEDDRFAPSSPYSASKAAAELQVAAYAQSYGLSATIVRACNIYGPKQHIEKFIPLFVTRALAGERMPLYGDGQQEREWLYVEDFVAGLRAVVAEPAGLGVRAFHVGSGERLPNIEVARAICQLANCPETLITTVTDRPGHDRRYALSSSRLRSIGWQPNVRFDEGLRLTLDWYRHEADEWREAAGAGFDSYFARQYGARLADVEH